MPRLLASLAICLGCLNGISSSAEDSGENVPAPPLKAAVNRSKPQPTHKQLRVLTPQHNGEKINLNTFCLSPTGDLLLCVGGPTVEYLPKPDNPSQYEIKRHQSPAFVQRYSPDGELLAAIPIDFKPTGINVIPNAKEIVVAGEGWIARLTLDGQVVKKSRTAQIGDYDKFKVQAAKEAEAEVKEHCQMYVQQLEQVEKTIAKLEKTPEGKRSSNVKAQIEAQKTLAKALEEQKSQMEEMFGGHDPEQAVRDRLTVTGVAATEQDIFVSVRKLKGHGFEIWRTNHDFGDAEKVMSDLGGCCGQLDIQASDSKLLIAENGKFRVGIYDRDGDMTKSFGKRDRKASDGFGSCCNPMNVRCCQNGEILTAESSIGDIKRFSENGEFLGYVGRARIGGGCKHVAIAFDPVRNRYYMQHQDKGQICVLVPIAEITGPSEEELQEQAAREGLGQSWSEVDQLERQEAEG